MEFNYAGFYSSKTKNMGSFVSCAEMCNRCFLETITITNNFDFSKNEYDNDKFNSYLTYDKKRKKKILFSLFIFFLIDC